MINDVDPVASPVRDVLEQLVAVAVALVLWYVSRV